MDGVGNGITSAKHDPGSSALASDILVTAATCSLFKRMDRALSKLLKATYWIHHNGYEIQTKDFPWLKYCNSYISIFTTPAGIIYRYSYILLNPLEKLKKPILKVHNMITGQTFIACTRSIRANPGWLIYFSSKIQFIATFIIPKWEYAN